MVWFDWLILVLPVLLVVAAGLRIRRHVRGVADFLSAGRLCNRYVLCMGDGANALSILGLVTFIEIRYRTGFAVAFWEAALAPLGVFLGLLGYVSYRFRETRAMSLGQFLEMRYSRRFRVFAAALRSLAEMLANAIMPAISVRFFLGLLDLPPTLRVAGLEISTYVALLALFLGLALTLVCCGGTLALIVTDTIQGMMLYPLLLCFVAFLFTRFSMADQVLPVLADRAPGESFLDPFDIGGLRDFNFFTMVVVVAYGMVMNRANWIGAGTSTAAKSPLEQKMAGLFGTWRSASVSVFYSLLACAIATFLCHADFAAGAGAARRELAERAAADALRGDPRARAAVEAAVAAMPPIEHHIGADPPLSLERNPDTEFLGVIHEALLAEARGAAGAPARREAREAPDSPALVNAEGRANDAFQRFRTLFYQQNLAIAMRGILPHGLFGLFALLMFLSMLSTDDTRIYSASLTIAQDVVLPLRRRPFSPSGHIRMIRIVSLCVGAFFFVGSCFLQQLDYIHMFVTLVLSMWVSGAGPVMIFGLYSRFGTTAGAWASQLTSAVASIAYVLVQRNWADVVYPALARAGLVGRGDAFLRALSAPFAPWISWRMHAVKCPVNSIEFSFFLSLFCALLYVVVSKLTCRKPFDLARMLHRDAPAAKASPAPTTGTPFLQRAAAAMRRVVGITPEYSRGDRLIAWGVFLYSFAYSFGVCFLGVVAWNAVRPWPISWWGRYFVIVNFAVPGVVAAVSTVWFGVGGVFGLRALFRDLSARRDIDESDNGGVS